MRMGPAEIVASLKELCETDGPRLTTDRIVGWIDLHEGFPSNAELIAFGKKMLARRYARMLTCEDEDTGLRIKRLWSFRDRSTGERYYVDILQLPEEKRRRMIQQYARFLDQLRSVRQALSDYFAGQQFFEFFGGEEEADEPFTLQAGAR